MIRPTIFNIILAVIIAINMGIYTQEYLIFITVLFTIFLFFKPDK